MRIVFMGTPDFAVPCLDMLIQHGYDVAGVVTAPDRTAGRGLEVKASPVKAYALSKGLNILQPLNLKNQAFLDELQSLKADLFVVVAFRMLPEVVWGMPPMGTINLHASLLPNYRGAAPINWAIINGEKETGLTTFFIEKDIDTGKIIFQEKMEIGTAETAGELHDRMMKKGAELMLKTVEAIRQETAPCTKQSFSGTIKKAPKIFREDCKIDWEQPAQEIYNFIRGLSPYPAAWTKLNGKLFKIFKADVQFEQHGQKSGSFSIQDDTLRFACADGFIIPKIVQMEGKRKMPVQEFLKGFKT